MQAVILAGGSGKGLRPLTKECPKPMLRLNGYPILHYLLKWLVAYGVSKIVICCHYRFQTIVDYFGDGSQFGIEIEYLVEDKPLGWAGALRRGLLFCSTLKQQAPNPILAVNADILTDLNLNELLAHHAAHAEPATLVSVPLISPY
ncbi:MAG: nucleotidyltransferase family protein [Cyanobacteria bacterium]|nr:nucleotidyltransferase family protein [Cyanobacteriota bacterium]